MNRMPPNFGSEAGLARLTAKIEISICNGGMHSQVPPRYSLNLFNSSQLVLVGNFL
jgi:hypothetical protein